jgi:hypothetical protein
VHGIEVCAMNIFYNCHAFHGGDLLPRKRSLKCNFEGFYPIDLIFYTLTDRFILRYALVSLFRIFQILAGK